MYCQLTKISMHFITSMEGRSPSSKSPWRQLWKDVSHSWIKLCACTLLPFPYHCPLITGVTPQ